MDTLILQALEHIRCRFLDIFFGFFTLLGEEMVVAGLIAVIFICFDKKLGERALVTVLSASLITTGVKSAVRRLRPYAAGAVTKADVFLTDGLDPDMSFPSGHATASGGFFASLSLGIRKAYIAIPSAVLILLIALSRLYLGVHYPSDVLAGLAVGIGMAFLWHIVYHGFYNIRLAVYLLLAALSFVLLFIPRTATESMFKISAVALASAIGLIVEDKFIRFADTDKWWKRAVRLGLTFTLAAIPYLLLSLLPDLLWYKFLQYFVTILVAMTGMPLLIRIFHL